MKTELDATPTARALTNEDIRDYAYHLYEVGGRRAGQDLENWLEAEACLRAIAADEPCPPAYDARFAPMVRAREWLQRVDDRGAYI